MSERKMPQPIKPRTLMRTRNPVHGHDYTTSDGRYEIYPIYKDRRYGGRTSAVDSWGIRDLHDNKAHPKYYPRLDDIRDYYCTPVNKMPWLVYDADEGVLRVEPTRQAAAAWASSLAEATKVLERHRYGSGAYEYVFGDSGGDICGNFIIIRADLAHITHYDATQQPLYPFPDDPFEQVDRPAPKAEEAA
jgi:hypothetical protein